MGVKDNPVRKDRICFWGMAVFLVLVGVMIVSSGAHIYCDLIVITTVLINIGIFFWQYMRAFSIHPFSFDMMVWLFSLVFFGYVPLLQHLSGRYSWSLSPANSEIVAANLCVLLWSMCYIFGRNAADKSIRNGMRCFTFLSCALEKLEGLTFRPLVSRLIKHQKNTVSLSESQYDLRLLQRYRQRDMSAKLLDLLLILAAILAVTDIAVTGLSAQFSRGDSDLDAVGGPGRLLLHHFIGNMLLFTASIHVFCFKTGKRRFTAMLLALFCLGIACFPTGLARNMMAAYYAGLLIVMFDKTRKEHWFAFVIVFGLILIFPAVEIFRDTTLIHEKGFINAVADALGRTYLQEHYDAHQNIVSVIRYVKEYGITWGWQLLGVLLFFVPRSIWPNKPTGSGHTAFSALNQNEFTNVSAPLVAEGFINFGILGIVLFALLIGFAVSLVDYRFWRKRNSWSLVDMLYPHTMFMFFFLLRGDLMSAGSYTFSMCVIAIFVYMVYRLGVSVDSAVKK